MTAQGPEIVPAAEAASLRCPVPRAEPGSDAWDGVHKDARPALREALTVHFPVLLCYVADTDAVLADAHPALRAVPTSGDATNLVASLAAAHRSRSLRDAGKSDGYRDAAAVVPRGAAADASRASSGRDGE